MPSTEKKKWKCLKATKKKKIIIVEDPLHIEIITLLTILIVINSSYRFLFSSVFLSFINTVSRKIGNNSSRTNGIFYDLSSIFWRTYIEKENEVKKVFSNGEKECENQKNIRARAHSYTITHTHALCVHIIVRHIRLISLYFEEWIS